MWNCELSKCDTIEVQPAGKIHNYYQPNSVLCGLTKVNDSQLCETTENGGYTSVDNIYGQSNVVVIYV